MSYRLFTKDKGTIGTEVEEIAQSAFYTELLDEVVGWAQDNHAALKPLAVHAVAGLALYKPLQGWEATLPNSTRKFVAISEEDDDEQQAAL